MHSQNRYSLVVMTHNRPGPLARCLESIDCFDWTGGIPEVVVVDDGSEPPVHFGEQGFKVLKPVVVRLEHLGVAAARNAGIDHSNEAFIAFIADDYILPPDYLTNIDTFFGDHPEAQVISHSIKPCGPYLFRPVQQLYFDLALGQSIPQEQAGQNVVYSSELPASRAAMFRREVFDQVGRFNESLRVGEDGEFGQRMAAAGIPVYFFPHKRISHYDVQSSADYFRQRLRYGRSFVRAGMWGGSLESMTRSSFLLRIPRMLKNKLASWWTVAGRLNLRWRYVLLTPFLVLFLLYFYFGAYAEFCDLRKSGFQELDQP
ncbi:MAG: glycosyltransferase family 2 protein [Xanthomonadales bacterium]|jgi:GT2 family glycosyltransferase|nr:glycosyltransferase family 2 protein [Xanthomonadales bacterium]